MDSANTKKSPKLVFAEALQRQGQWWWAVGCADIGAGPSPVPTCMNLGKTVLSIPSFPHP